MYILGLCADKGLLDLFLQDARRIPAGLQIETLSSDLTNEGIASMAKHYRHTNNVVLLMADGSKYSEAKIKALIEQSDAAFSYYRNGSDRWFKYLKNRIKPVSVDYRLTEFWFMLGSIYATIVAQLHKEESIMQEPGLVFTLEQIGIAFGQSVMDRLTDTKVLALYVRFDPVKGIVTRPAGTGMVVITNGVTEGIPLTSAGVGEPTSVNFSHEPLRTIVTDCGRTLVLSRIDAKHFFVGGLTTAEIDYVNSVALVPESQETQS